METQERDTLLQVAGLLNPATVRIERITRAIRKEPLDKLESAGIPGDIRSLRDEYAPLDDSLRSSCQQLRENWPAVQNNRGLLYELRLFEDTFSSFTHAIRDFDDAVTADETAAIRLLGDYEASREYTILAAQYTRELQPAFDYEHSLHSEPRIKLSPLQGLCEEMSGYYQGKTDQELEDAILRDTYGGPRGIWTGTLTQATYFGQHFKISAQVMNKLFSFYGENGQPRKAHFTRYPATKITSTDPLAIILSKYPRKK